MTRDLPASEATTDPERGLYAIQRLQFTDIHAANDKLTEFFRDILPFTLSRAEIIPRAVSLNSISGSLISDAGDSYFFKTHVEPDSVLREYYNVELLRNAGYPIINPVFADQTPGQQIVVYPYIQHRTVFDLATEFELRDCAGSGPLMQAQIASDKQLFEIYTRTLLEDNDPTESPIHQLFYYRLFGKRFRDFYSTATFTLDGQELSFARVAECRWIINGVEYEQTLAELIEEASVLLQPNRSWGATVIGHGDAHNGNLFFDEKHEDLIYFDPAFAGRHSPLLDLVKPLFHNIFATWMYQPREVHSTLSLSCVVFGNRIEVTHNYRPSELRRQMLSSKVEHVLHPLLTSRRMSLSQDADNLRSMRLALLCCPFLTVNLADRDRYPAAVSILALSQCIELASSAPRGGEVFDFLSQLAGLT